MPLNDLKTWIEISQDLVTIAGITLAGVWSVYLFALGRSFAPNVKLEVELKQVLKLTTGYGVVISVKAQNIGRTRVKKESCQITLAPVLQIEVEGQPLTRLDPPLPELMKQFPRQYEVFHEHASLEPDETATEDILVACADPVPVKVNVMFFGIRPIRGRREQWAASVILNPAPPERGAKSRRPQ